MNTDVYVEKKTQPTFARHETFHPRYGWLKKGFDRALECPDVFLREDAPVVLGVGKNMVRAIRYWCNAFKILIEDRSGRASGHGSVPTELGHQLLANTGWDPYLESLSSLWWLHWKLLSAPCYATSWHFAFNCFHKIDFATDTLFIALREYVDTMYPANRVVDASLKKDVSCILRMYGGNTPASADDSIGCPFAGLGMIRPSEKRDNSYFLVGEKPGLAAPVVAAACLEYAAQVSPTARTISASSLLYDEGSPGQVFKLDEAALCTAVETIENDFGTLHLGETAGLLQVSFDGAPLELSHKCLEHTFDGKANG